MATVLKKLFSVKIIKHKNELILELNAHKSIGKSIGFVPTMGALHEGHISLVTKCRSENDIVVVSIFVNPTQFNDKNDLAKYPRMPDMDFNLLRAATCDIVFSPDVDEMYPEPDKRSFDFGKIGEVMEGTHRFGHFNGVAQIVSKLFDVVAPNKAYFGEKDFQQLAIIKQLVKDHDIPVEIVACPTLRESDGLAMSSRNLLLGKDERKAAPLISATLRTSLKMKDTCNVNDLKEWVISQINSNPFLKVEYFEIVDELELQPINDWKENVNKVGCIAVKSGNIRLIDNIRF